MDAVKPRKVKVLKSGAVRGDSRVGQELEINLSDADLKRLLDSGACEDLAVKVPKEVSEAEKPSKPKK